MTACPEFGALDGNGSDLGYHPRPDGSLIYTDLTGHYDAVTGRPCDTEAPLPQSEADRIWEAVINAAWL